MKRSILISVLVACGAPTAPPLEVHTRDGKVTAVYARDGEVIVADDVHRDPTVRARDFLAGHGGLIGAADGEPFTARTAFVDATGTHVRVDQTHRGLPVFGGELIVHMTDAGITGVTGRYVDAIAVAAAPAIDDATARAIAAGVASKHAREPMTATAHHLAVYRAGLVERGPVSDHLAWAVEVAGGADRFQVWIDAVTGAPLARFALNHTAKFRVAYAGAFTADRSPSPYQPGLTAVCREDRPNGGLACLGLPKALFRFSGQTYDLFAQAFGRDSYDGEGIKMRTVNLVNQNCPNAYWDGATTNYCPLFELDDVVAHEWGHAYTQHTHDLVYAYQSGALNEAYSDIWGETVDLHNGEDGLAGGANAAPPPAGVRWQVGEDFLTGNGEYELLLRDMWDPDRLGYPGKVTSPNYACGSDDGGGVHTNSGVPNHAYALLVDGGAYNGQTIRGIGFAKAAAIYYRAQTVHQTKTSDFVDHADAVETSCRELAGSTPNNFLDVTAPASPITEDDCAQVDAAMLAVEMRTPPSCPFVPLLAPDPPAACAGTIAFAETWQSGIGAWTRSFDRTGDAPNPYHEWIAVDTRPYGAPGKAAFAINATSGTCAAGGDESGAYMLASPLLTAPATGTLELRFDHLVETEGPFDGAQLSISVGGGAFQLVPRTAFRHNPPNQTFDAAFPLGQNTNPRAGQAAWSGADEGRPTGSWGTSVVNLSALVQPGQTYRLRFDFSMDGCNGVTGWYLGDLSVMNCP